MKELVIVGQYDPYHVNVGGVEIYLENFIKELRNLKVPYTLIGWTKGGKKTGKFVPIVESDSLLGRKFSFNLLFKAPFIRIPNSSTIIIDRPDRVIPFYFRKNKIVCYLHGSHHKNLKDKKGRIAGSIYGFFERMALRRADAIISVSKENQVDYLRKYPELKNKIHVIPVGVRDNFKPMAQLQVRKKLGLGRGPFGIYAGRFSKEKRLHKILEAFKNLDSKYLVIGDGPEEKRLKDMAGDNIIFLGRKPNTELPEYFNAADFLVMFSEHEGLPTIVLEALGCGKPILTTAVGDLKEIIQDGKNGYIVDEKNLRKRIIDVSRNSKKMKTECLKTSERFRWKNIIKEILELC